MTIRSCNFWLFATVGVEKQGSGSGESRLSRSGGRGTPCSGFVVSHVRESGHGAPTFDGELSPRGPRRPAEKKDPIERCSNLDTAEAGWAGGPPFGSSHSFHSQHCGCPILRALCEGWVSLQPPNQHPVLFPPPRRNFRLNLNRIHGARRIVAETRPWPVFRLRDQSAFDRLPPQRTKFVRRGPRLPPQRTKFVRRGPRLPPQRTKFARRGPGLRCIYRSSSTRFNSE